MNVINYLGAAAAHQREVFTDARDARSRGRALPNWSNVLRVCDKSRHRALPAARKLDSLCPPGAAAPAARTASPPPAGARPGRPSTSLPLFPEIDLTPLVGRVVEIHTMCSGTYEWRVQILCIR
ncbi:hypothetical protein EVAR_89545_1 [Eumeta japonica]|uniref:Uncharacterized protein n=1 Tax=Eumeta variegata TaxID=151549 RepID=A0A4C1ZB38_EUMVA|nr:hypothetical protein EVAR_89545_1 [Eumeta japonica]